MKTILITDSNCDLHEGFLIEHHIPVIPFHFIIKGEDYEDDFGKSMSHKAFYDALRSGEMASTAQITPYIYEEYFRRYVRLGYAVIYIGFSSTLSESFNHSILARNMVLEDHPEAVISLVDSRSASVGQGLLVAHAAQLLEQGKSHEEIVTWLEEHKLKVNHWFLVDSLDHLKRGGRLSATSAAIGTMFNIKPVLIVDGDGKLVAAEKIRGRKKAIRYLFEQLKTRGTNVSDQTVYITHGDCLEDAEKLADMIKVELGVRGVVINDQGPIIGAHTGPGFLSLVFMGESR